MYKALRYTYSLLHRLTRYHLDGRYRIDNNVIENDIRPLALGRKNYLFCGNHDAAENMAIMYSLFGCCKAADVNPREWLTDVLTRIPQYNRITAGILLNCSHITGKRPINSRNFQKNWKLSEIPSADPINFNFFQLISKNLDYSY